MTQDRPLRGTARSRTRPVSARRSQRSESVDTLERGQQAQDRPLLDGRGILRSTFGLDLRSLALFRVAFSTFLIADLIDRMRDLEAHYTDAGVLPRRIAEETVLANPYLWSLHLANGQLWFQVALFGIALAAAIALLFGYKTRLATFVSWLLLASLQTRNPLVLQGGDGVLRLTLFWSLFLPLGACFSLDAALARAEEPRRRQTSPLFASVGTAAFLFQLSCIYVFSVFFKSDPVWHREGTAVYYALSLQQFARPLGSFVRGFPAFTTLMTHVTVLFEAYAPILLLFPIFSGWVRTFTAFAFILFHTTLGLCMDLGVFSYATSIAWLCVLATPFWDTLAQRFANAKRTDLIIRTAVHEDALLYLLRIYAVFAWLDPDSVQVGELSLPPSARPHEVPRWSVADSDGTYYYGRDALALLASRSPLAWAFRRFRGVRVAGTRISEAAYSVMQLRLIRGALARIRGGGKPYSGQVSPLAQALTLFFLGYVLLWNLRTTNPGFYSYLLPESWNRIGFALRLDQQWALFSPRPYTADGWHVVVGHTEDGHDVDLLNNDHPVTWELPAHVNSIYRNHRWRKVLDELREPRNGMYLVYYAQYLTRDWNRRHVGGSRLRGLDIYFVRREVLPGYAYATPVRVLLWHHLTNPAQTTSEDNGSIRSDTRKSDPGESHAIHTSQP